MTKPAAGGNTPALPSRRHFLGSAAAVATIPNDADAPFFVLLRQYEKLGKEWAEIGDALFSAEGEFSPHKAAEKEARVQLDTIAKEVEREIFDAEPVNESATRRQRI